MRAYPALYIKLEISISGLEKLDSIKIVFQCKNIAFANL